MQFFGSFGVLDFFVWLGFFVVVVVGFVWFFKIFISLVLFMPD